MPVPLVEVVRSNLVESIHYGDLVAVDTKGNILYQAGDPHLKTYMRSTAKPFQAMPVVMDGISDYYGFTPKEIAIMCASHYAEPEHRATVQSILNKIGCTHQDLLCGTTTSLKLDYAFQLARDHVELNPLFSDCSGKHAGMLAYCKYHNLPIDQYTESSHPLQQRIKQVISDFSNIPPHQIHEGIDGCTVPSFGIPIYNMALAYAGLASPQNLSPEYQTAAETIVSAIVQHPFMISGTGGFCTALIQAGEQNIIGKIGAEAVYCVGIKSKGIGIALKISSGDMSVLSPVIVSLLEKLKLISKKQSEQLQAYKVIPIFHDRHELVGEKRAILPD